MIRPKNAALVWCDSDWVYLDLPSPEKTHRVRFPNNFMGLCRLLEMLRARTEKSTIGQIGDLTQWNVDMALKKANEKKTLAQMADAHWAKQKPKEALDPELRAAAQQVLREAGLI